MKSFSFLMLMVGSLHAAIPPDAVWQIQTISSSDTNGGCFSTSNMGATGVDHSTGAGTAFTSTLSATGSTTLTDSGAGFSNTMLGNCIFINGQGTFNIQAFTSSSIVTVDRNLGTFSTTSGHEGGPVASLGHACGNAGSQSGQIFFIKNDGTFSVTSATSGADGGTCTAQNWLFVGYTSNRTVYNTDSPPTIQLNVASATLFGNAGGGDTVFNMILDGNAQATSKLSSGNVFLNTQLKNFTAASSGTNLFINVSVTGSSAAVLAGNCIYCEAFGNTAAVYSFNGGQYCFKCLSYSNTGASTDGFIFTNGPNGCFFCTSNSNGRDGFRAIAANTNVYFLDSYAEGNTGDGFNIAGATAQKFLLGFGYQGNGTNFVSSGTVVQTTAIAPASSAMVSATNLAPNNTANAGALLRNAAIPATFLRGLTATFLDVGAARHQDPSNPGTVTVGIPNVQ